MMYKARIQQPKALSYRPYRRIHNLPIKMTSHKDSRSDVPTEQSTSYFNASYFPESSTFIDNEVDFNDVFGHFDDGNIAPFTTPASYNNLRRQTEAEKGTSSAQGLILGNSNALYQPYYPTNEEVPITAGLGTDLINWKLCSRNSSSYTGTRSQTSGQRTSRPSKNGQTPPTICETATIVNGGQAEFENEDIDLDKAAKENFDHLTRFNKQKSIMQHVDTTIQSESEQFPSLQSTKVFFPNWEIEAYHHTTPIDVGAIDNMGLHFEADADSTVSKSQTQSSVFTGDHRRAAGTAPSVTSYTESSIADSNVSERFKSRMVPTNYPRYLEDDAFTYHSGYSGHESMSAAEYAQISMVPPNLQYAFDTALEQFNASFSPTQPMPSLSPIGYHQQKRLAASPSPSPQPSKRRLKRDHICPTCNANFTEKTNLTRHIKSRKCTKTGPDMFYCPVSGCTRFYEGRSDNLKAHMKRVHRKEWNKLKSFQGDWKEKSSLAGHLYACA
ncbi:hypothetical protein TWF106_000049 [Orbilia oligospora]|uniref:C2H2-type domain-containing protein n=2 Tax=Orbilia oligospora TaxID=2813651 RepID=A0A6G1ML02_ORBOL|nr:hypothetical protein TWF788_008102 [Orbilia oligospora]KAF3221752.1 hypothetical protein TWF679_006965 [Orbilia oligospora]KAF3229662.1 hypothetical protein TWF106_000049 [Orbilia oligospora]KAF3230102.1 hypothetical protein TWF191_000343 [Orbilia oligospora]KAF3262492.1 hypothetical protein TWF192_007168 [Orbilia oligospora]